MNMTLAQKQALQTFLSSGNTVGTIAYDPTLVAHGTPEGNAVAAGWTQYSALPEQTSTNLDESIYIKAL